MADTLTALVSRLVGAPRADIRLAERSALPHQSNRLYDVWVAGRHLIAKEFLKPEEQAVAPAREHGAMRLLAPLVVAPQPVAMCPAAAPLGPVVLYQYLEGEMWDRHHPSAAELGALAELWLRVASVPTAGLWPARGEGRSLASAAARLASVFDAYAAWAKEAFPAGAAAVALCREAFARLEAVVPSLLACEPRLRFCRRDARFANVIRRPDERLALVDWEDSGLADPAADVADLLNHPNQEDLVPPEAWEAFLEPYLSAVAADDPGIGRRLECYCGLMPAYWLTAFMREGLRRAADGSLAGWRANELPGNERMRRYLARALAWPATDFGAELERLRGVTFFPEGG